MRLAGLGLTLLVGCSQIAGIGGEFRAGGDGGIDDVRPDVAPGFRQLAYIKASNPGPGDTFGVALAVSADGATIAVGAPYEDSSARGVDGTQADELGLDSGAVYIFVKSADTWIQQAYIKSGNSDAGDQFGHAVALSDNGSTLIVGAPLEDAASSGVDGTSGGNSSMESGAAYIFRRTGVTWAQTNFFKASTNGPSDQFGWNVAISGDGNTAAVTAIFEDSAAVGIGGNQADNTQSSAGAVYVFTFATTWTQQAYVKPSNTQSAMLFGRGLALSRDGNTMLVTAPEENSPGTGVNGTQTGTTATNSGSAYVFVRSGTNWSQQSYIKSLNSQLADKFGFSAALSADGNVALVSAPGEDSAAVGINGNHSDNSADASGAAYLFTRVGTTWMQQAYVKATNTDAGDGFGIRVSLSADGETFMVGASNESGGGGVDGDQTDNTLAASGATYVYSRATLSPLHYLKATHGGVDDHFGYLGPGCVNVVGAPDEDSAATGVDGDSTNNGLTSAGAVYVFGE